MDISTFESGCIREADDEKVKWSLFSPTMWQLLLGDGGSFEATVSRHVISWLKGETEIIHALAQGLYEIGHERVAKVLADGAEKYSAFNWTKGMPVSRCVDSLGRHLWAVKLGKDNEDHEACAVCNLMFIQHYCMAYTNDMEGVYSPISKDPYAGSLTFGSSESLSGSGLGVNTGLGSFRLADSGLNLNSKIGSLGTSKE